MRVTGTDGRLLCALNVSTHLNRVKMDPLNLTKTFLDPFSIFGAIPGRHQAISQLSARILTAPPPSGVKVFFFISGTRVGDIGYTSPYFMDAECTRSTLFPTIDT